MHSWSIGWLRGWLNADRDVLTDLLQIVLGPPKPARLHVPFRLDASVKFLEAGGLAWRTDGGRTPLLLDLPASALDKYVKSGNLRLLLDYLAEHHFKPTRIDLSLDVEDNPKLKLMTRVEAAFRAKNYSPYRSAEFMASHGERGGRTCYFGNASGSYWRIYEKSKEAGLDGNLVRFEYQAMHEDAGEAWRRYRQDKAGMVLDTIDFRRGYGLQRGKNGSHAARCLRFAWWEHVRQIGHALEGWDVHEREMTIEGMLSWMRKTWAKPLSSIAKVYGWKETLRMVKAISENAEPTEERIAALTQYKSDHSNGDVWWAEPKFAS